MISRNSVAASRPTERPRINYAHPVARKLRNAIVFGANGPYDAVSRRALQLTTAFGSPILGPTPYGFGLRTPNGSAATIALAQDWSGACTVVYRCWINSVDANFGGLWSKNTTTTNQTLGVGRNSTSDDWYIGRNATAVTALTSSSIVSDSSTLVVHGVTNSDAGSAATIAMYRNGVLVQSAAANASAQLTGAGDLHLGTSRDLSATFDSDVWWYEFLRFDSVLSAAEMAYIGKDTRQLFARRRIWAPVSAGGGTGVPTLSAATVFNITSTTARPRVTVTF